MANNEIAPTDEWRKIRRAGGGLPRFAPVITVRRDCNVAVSADFVRMADIGRCSRATIFVSSDGFGLGFRFHSAENDDDAFFLSADGGSGIRNGGLSRVIQSHSIKTQAPAIVRLSQESLRVRRLEPKRIHTGLWTVRLAPCFEQNLVSGSDVIGSATGIYRYRHGDEIVYIGRGNLKCRFAAPERREWAFDKVEFSVLNDDAAERHWESFWLNEFRQKHGRWPLLNVIGGIAQVIGG